MRPLPGRTGKSLLPGRGGKKLLFNDITYSSDKISFWENQTSQKPHREKDNIQMKDIHVNILDKRGNTFESRLNYWWVVEHLETKKAGRL